MSESPDPKPMAAADPKHSEWRTPQVILPIIATISTILVAVIGVIPSIIEANKPPALTPTPIIIAIIATPVPTNTAVTLEITATFAPTAAPTDRPTQSAPTAAPTDNPTQSPPTAAPPTATAIPPTDVPTLAPTEASAIEAAPTSIPNVTLFYDHDSFTILNQSGSRISLEGITFRGESITWDVGPFGGLMRSLPNNKCLRMRDATVGNRQPPAACGSSMYGFLEVGPTAIFWRGSTFDVVRDNNVIATCAVDTGTCPIYVAPKS